MRTVILCILIGPLIARAQFTDNPGEPDQKLQTSSATIRSTLADEAIEEISDSAPTKYLSEKPEKSSIYPYSDLFEPDLPLKREYIASVDIMNIIRPGRVEDGHDNAAELVFGVKRPYYRLGKNIRCAGVLDLKIAKSIAGCDNTLIIAFGYDIKKDIYNRTIDAGISLLNVGFKITIPVSLR